MKNLDVISEELFNKIRGRFQNVTIGDEQGTITNEPALARFFDFEYTEGEAKGKVSISISEDEGLTVIYSDDFIANESDTVKNNWYNFLKELRVFARKRLLNFDTRDITKSNLNKRDYKFLAKNRSGEETMTESRLYGTSQTSYQDIDGARLVIKHTKPVNMEMAAGRTQHVGRIYIESAEGERFKYPYKHLSGARAMARHVAEGGTAYDDFGKHIVGLSEEMAKLRKFKNYMGRSAVMAESLAGYMDIVKERISTVKKTIESLQKAKYYKEAFEAFEIPVLEDVPSDVAENWIDELTIRQFNEELQDIFPYIYNLVKEGTRAKELGPEELEEYEKQKGVDGKACWKGYKRMGTKKKGGKTVDNCVKVEDQFEEALDNIMGQFSEAANDCDETCPKSCPDCGGTGDPEKYKADQTSEAKGKDLDHDGDVDSDDYMKAKDIAIKKAMGKEKKESQTPLPEFILSYFDRENGQFPKGETAILTMVEKDYGEQFIEPAKQFIEMINNKVAEMYGYRESDLEEGKVGQIEGVPLKWSYPSKEFGGFVVNVSPKDVETYKNVYGKPNYEQHNYYGDRNVTTLAFNFGRPFDGEKFAHEFDAMQQKLGENSQQIETDREFERMHEEMQRIRQLAGLPPTEYLHEDVQAAHFLMEMSDCDFEMFCESLSIEELELLEAGWKDKLKGLGGKVAGMAKKAGQTITPIAKSAGSKAAAGAKAAGKAIGQKAAAGAKAAGAAAKTAGGDAVDSVMDPVTNWRADRAEKKLAKLKKIKQNKQRLAKAQQQVKDFDRNSDSAAPKAKVAPKSKTTKKPNLKAVG